MEGSKTIAPRKHHHSPHKPILNLLDGYTSLRSYHVHPRSSNFTDSMPFPGQRAPTHSYGSKSFQDEIPYWIYRNESLDGEECRRQSTCFSKPSHTSALFFQQSSSLNRPLSTQNVFQYCRMCTDKPNCIFSRQAMLAIALHARNQLTPDKAQACHVYLLFLLHRYLTRLGVQSDHIIRQRLLEFVGDPRDVPDWKDLRSAPTALETLARLAQEETKAIRILATLQEDQKKLERRQGWCEERE